MRCLDEVLIQAQSANMRYCDRSLAGVHLSAYPQIFKYLLLNLCANLNETWQGCSLGDALPKLLKELNSTYNSGCHDNKKGKIAKY